MFFKIIRLLKIPNIFLSITEILTGFLMLTYFPENSDITFANIIKPLANIKLVAIAIILCAVRIAFLEVNKAVEDKTSSSLEVEKISKTFIFELGFFSLIIGMIIASLANMDVVVLVTFVYLLIIGYAFRVVEDRKFNSLLLGAIHTGTIALGGSLAIDLDIVLNNPFYYSRLKSCLLIMLIYWIYTSLIIYVVQSIIFDKKSISKIIFSIILFILFILCVSPFIIFFKKINLMADLVCLCVVLFFSYVIAATLKSGIERAVNNLSNYGFMVSMLFNTLVLSILGNINNSILILGFLMLTIVLYREKPQSGIVS